MTKVRRFPCHRPGCRRRAKRLGGYCSRSCNRRWHLAMIPAAQRQATCQRIRAMQWTQAMNRMLLRIKVMADTEDARLVLAWRYGKNAARSARYRERQKGAAA